LALLGPLQPYLPTRQAAGQEHPLILPAQLAVFVHRSPFTVQAAVYSNKLAIQGKGLFQKTHIL
jgi:hypothetical protein